DPRIRLAVRLRVRPDDDRPEHAAAAGMVQVEEVVLKPHSRPGAVIAWAALSSGSAHQPAPSPPTLPLKGRAIEAARTFFYFALPTLSVLSMNAATLSCSCLSDSRCAYTMWPDS